MRKVFVWMWLALFLGGLISCVSSGDSSQWELVWEDDFNGTSFDTATWSKIPRANPEWARHMSDNEACYEMRDGNLVLKGIVNTDLENDTAPYITGGVYTKNKRGFHGGRLEVKAKLQGAQGAWPAIWLKPCDEAQWKWPWAGEIDVMERLNHDSIAYQTIHTAYTIERKQTRNPRHGSKGTINPDDYNVYAVEMYPDSLVFFINENRTFTYPRIDTGEGDELQFPFKKPYYLLIDMQLDGGWVGPVDTLDLPVEMVVDWVRYYKEKE